MNDKKLSPKLKDDDEIDLTALFKRIWAGRKVLFICLFVGTLIGVLVAVTAPKSYTVTTVLVPQGSSKSGTSQLGGLAALAGISLDMTQQSSDLSPIVYPKIVSSVPFKLELMNSPIQFEGYDKPISLIDFYTDPRYQKTSTLNIVKKYTIGLPGVIIGLVKGIFKKEEELTTIIQTKGDKKEYYVLSKKQAQIAKMLEGMVSLEVETKQGYLTLIVEMPEALAAAQVAQYAQQLLQKKITAFKVQKAQADLEFIQGRYNTAKAQAEGLQYSIAVKADKYKDLTSAVPLVDNTRTQTKYGVANGVFLELAKQLEQAKIQVKRDTPVFTIVEPVTVPTEKTKPNRPMLLMICVFMGGVIGVAIILGKGFIANLKQKWRE